LLAHRLPQLETPLELPQHKRVYLVGLLLHLEPPQRELVAVASLSCVDKPVVAEFSLVVPVGEHHVLFLSNQPLRLEGCLLWGLRLRLLSLPQHRSDQETIRIQALRMTHLLNG
jgi:hypothetical protein